MNVLQQWNDTIVAVATAPGVGAIAVIRLSGNKAIEIADEIFAGKKLQNQPGYSMHYGFIQDGDEKVDEVLVAIFKAPHSYTGEDIVEISCHGSLYVQQAIVNLCIEKGARLAHAGEFTQRAFLNGKMDLSRAEAVGDLIAAETKAAQQTALHQLRGGFANDLAFLREELIGFTALLELELDFSEEDVEFADRAKFFSLIAELKAKVEQLLQSFTQGNVIKKGVRVAIIGKPNAGKSTLLNALLKEERAIVSDIPGTTRDAIEEVLNIDGVQFRLIDTAGIRTHSTDIIENLGIERSRENAERADIILYLKDLTQPQDNIDLEWLEAYTDKIIDVGTKYNLLNDSEATAALSLHTLCVDAKSGWGIEALKQSIFDKALGATLNTNQTIVTNARHHEALSNMHESILAIEAGLKNNLSGDLLTIDIRRALYYLGLITGQVEIDRDVLGAIFGKFCIGK